jgi:hypothetical protein
MLVRVILLQGAPIAIGLAVIALSGYNDSRAKPGCDWLLGMAVTGVLFLTIVLSGR